MVTAYLLHGASEPYWVDLQAGWGRGRVNTKPMRFANIKRRQHL